MKGLKGIFQMNNFFMPFLAILGIAGASFICYWSATDLFFVADDFVWLERVKCLIPKDPVTIFKSEGLYFDPLVYFSFWLNYNFSGLEPFWYHAVDVFIHTTNALLVACLALLLTQNKVAAFLSGLIFAVSPTTADAVLWSSSRVDTLAATFYLSSITSYVVYQKKEEGRFYHLSIIFFIISLSAKSTPIIIIFIILILEVTFPNKKAYKTVLIRTVPFFMIVSGYLMLLFFDSPQTVTHTFQGILNMKSFLRGVSVLFFPESLIASNGSLYIILSLLLLVSLIGLSIFFISARFALIVFTMIISLMLPLLFMSMSYIYATPSDSPNYVLASVCHRIYIAVSGFSILMGTMISFILFRLESFGKLIYTIILGLLFTSILTYGYSSINNRTKIWKSNEKDYMFFVSAVEAFKPYIKNSSLSNLYIINSPFRSFTNSIFRLYLSNCNLNIVHSQVPDIRTSYGKDMVLVFNNQSYFTIVTPEIQEYQIMISSCRNIIDKKAEEVCLDGLAQKVNQRLFQITGQDQKTDVSIR